MEAVKIDGAKLNEAQVAAKAIEASVKKTYESCEKLAGYVHSAKWSGKSRDNFLTYLEIIQLYHKDITSAVEKQTKALNNLERYVDDFKRDSAVQEVRNL
ncbi:hypothetical protein [Sporosarcina sp. 6E9]|uniref:WXG100 family type VII secretion target n=1 Tax=Sporosarcina sp. 6E9 TaxID=2819235 RepID=UPI001B301C31|nr:hypothetical protein [Sporosarcina sp. 6E9]